MKGARELAPLFPKPVQIGRLLIWAGSHARGRTLNVWVLPEGEVIKSCPGMSQPRIPEAAVRVFGDVSGQTGWTEVYGWIHEGPWIDDFRHIVKERRDEADREATLSKQSKDRKEQAERERIVSVLSSYPKTEVQS